MGNCGGGKACGPSCGGRRNAASLVLEGKWGSAGWGVGVAVWYGQVVLCRPRGGNSQGGVAVCEPRYQQPIPLACLVSHHRLQPRCELQGVCV